MSQKNSDLEAYLNPNNALIINLVIRTDLGQILMLSHQLTGWAIRMELIYIYSAQQAQNALTRSSKRSRKCATSCEATPSQIRVPFVTLCVVMEPF